MKEEKKQLQDQLSKYLESQTAKDIKTLTAFTIIKTPTVQDDLIVQNIDDVKDVLSASIEDVAVQVATKQTTFRDAKKAAVSLLKTVAEITGSKWLKVAVNFISTFI
jgi:hypothetical protein